ncbi:hypothetical protein C8R43DRAFT_502645 [Mycena crocata]|nr:hypothetical protein C8R43DRAFT_502645 [Mycena crocata]
MHPVLTPTLTLLLIHVLLLRLLRLLLSLLTPSLRIIHFYPISPKKRPTSSSLEPNPDPRPPQTLHTPRTPRNLIASSSDNPSPSISARQTHRESIVPPRNSIHPPRNSIHTREARACNVLCQSSDSRSNSYSIPTRPILELRSVSPPS